MEHREEITITYDGRSWLDSEAFKKLQTLCKTHNVTSIVPFSDGGKANLRSIVLLGSLIDVLQVRDGMRRERVDHGRLL